MQFHLEFSPKHFLQKINHQDKLLLIGSCFTENMGAKLKQHKFSVIENPNGILFNPISIAAALSAYVQNKHHVAEDLFYENEVWNSWQHHTRFSNADKAACLDNINDAQDKAHAFLHNAGWLLITLGSAFVYENVLTNEVVANCHKVPTDKFNRRLLAVQEVTDCLSGCIKAVRAFNPGVNIIFTISPVRHLREGFVENNRSKAALIAAVHQVIEAVDRCFYFPAYELIIDDLRDYRFYAEDMVHPNYTATNYVWEKFVEICIDGPTIHLMKAINDINAAKSHKPFHQASAAHKHFLLKYLHKLEELERQFPYIDFEPERNYFSATTR
jgi:GSCFA family